MVLKEITEGLPVEKVLNQTLTQDDFNLTLCDPLGLSLKEIHRILGGFTISTICLIGIKLVKKKKKKIL